MAPSRDDDRGKEPPRGRRGGKTTVTPLMVRMTFWIDRDVEERLRKDAYETNRTEAELVREALRLYFDIE
ncbi:MAG TPA: hypothetical protein VMR44_03070 [Thermoanaerobaculia bacterium]|nr:hypothetical protein [Thermoanaerobaculia bacterium]